MGGGGVCGRGEKGGAFCSVCIFHNQKMHVYLIYKYKTYTLTPFVKPRNILNLAIQNIFYVQFCVESTFTYNPGPT